MMLGRQLGRGITVHGSYNEYDFSWDDTAIKKAEIYRMVMDEK